MKNSVLDAIVIGAGAAGLSVSYHLKEHGSSFLVFEKGKIGHTWSEQRWDSFRFNTPNMANHLPGLMNELEDPQGFCSAKDFVVYLISYCDRLKLPVEEDSEVLSVRKPEGSDRFELEVKRDGRIDKYESMNVIVASGVQNDEIIPDLAMFLPPDIIQLHSADYHNSGRLPEGAVLVVGSAQSGVQIAEDLAESGKEVFLSTSRVARIPRRYRGKDVMEWLNALGFNDHTKETVPDPQMLKMKQPQVSGVGKRGKTMSLQSLAKMGVTILGRLDKVDGNVVFFQDNAAEHVMFADAFSLRVKQMIDGFIEKSGQEAPAAEMDPADIPDESAQCASHETTLDFRDKNITSIIWATGFRGNLSYIQHRLFDDEGELIHEEGVSDIQGLYYIGIPWMRSRKSGIIVGMASDAEYICEQIMEKEGKAVH